jgi:uncharacterized protein
MPVRPMSHKLRELSGFGLVALGVVGCLLPIIPGIPFLAAGVAVLGTDHVLVRRSRAWLEGKGIMKRPQRDDSRADLDPH